MIGALERYIQGFKVCSTLISNRKRNRKNLQLHLENIKLTPKKLFVCVNTKKKTRSNIGSLQERI